MLRYSKLEEALAYLTEQTERTWTESELFELATHLELDLTAVAPASARTVILTLKPGEGLVEEWRSPLGHALFAVLFPFQVMQLWMRGETTTRHPLDHDKLHFKPKMFVEEVHVTPAEVRISLKALQSMLSAWRHSKTGGEGFFPQWMLPGTPQSPSPGAVASHRADDAQTDSIPRAREPSTAVNIGSNISGDKNKWDEFELRRLMNEAQEPDASHQKLADRYGVSRQFIGKQLGKAREAYGPKKASFADSLKR